MALDDNQLAQLAKLAHLELDPAKLESIRADLSKMMELADKVTAATADVAQPIAHIQDGTQRLRTDEPAPAPQKLFEAAAETAKGMVAVPKVIE